MKKPVVFISSTCFDFRDLRSSLKYYLEELGYEVLLSEYNDFKSLNKENSFQSCLDAIKKCDYFVLLIGSRVGGFYNANENISITRKEYQEAYKIFLKGKIRIIPDSVRLYLKKDNFVAAFLNLIILLRFLWE